MEVTHVTSRPVSAIVPRHSRHGAAARYVAGPAAYDPFRQQVERETRGSNAGPGGLPKQPLSAQSSRASLSASTSQGGVNLMGPLTGSHVNSRLNSGRPGDLQSVAGSGAGVQTVHAAAQQNAAQWAVAQRAQPQQVWQLDAALRSQQQGQQQGPGNRLNWVVSSQQGGLALGAGLQAGAGGGYGAARPMSARPVSVRGMSPAAY